MSYNNFANQIRQHVSAQINRALSQNPMYQQSFYPMFNPQPAGGQQRSQNYGGGQSSPQIGSFSNVDPSNRFQQNVVIGSFSNVGPDNTIDSNTRIDNYVTMGSSNKVQPDCRIGSYASIGDRNFIGCNTIIEGFTSIANDNNIGAQCKVLSYASIQNHVTIENDAKLCDYSTVFNNAKISMGSVLDRYSKLSSGAKLDPYVYLGQYSSVDGNIPNSVVIHEYVTIPRDSVIVPREVIIRSPSSLQLYQQCASLKDIPSNYLLNVDASLNQLIDEQINEFRNNCGQRTFDKLAFIKSLYLIKYHGLETFKRYEPQVKFPNDFNMGTNCSPTAVLYQNLENETHFGPNASKDILGSDWTQKMVKVLVIEQDSRRRERCVGDDRCDMIREILNDQRKVTCAKRNLSVFCTGNYNSF
ncbi:uncharacterized protein LOC116346130 isoform X2 [Contarinia nasturtii]|nr:uncharacterized protein LOC116346130 isoform X2 [Contarinia nasturtii]XP_031631911.1 uncharacterized protein LOC116346130 isoform X2 [Contarinia nasturtii]